MVVFNDFSVKAQLSLPDMRIPISFAINYPDRIINESEPLSFEKIGKLDFLSLAEAPITETIN